MKDIAKITILGARGSTSLSDSRFQRYGGATSCILLQIAGETILLDAGSGLLNFRSKGDAEDIHILISHSHIDHIIGLPTFAPMFHRKRRYHIYGKTRNGLTIAEQIETLMRPPLWPAGTDSFADTTDFHMIDDSFTIGQVTIDCLESNHPDGSTIYKIIHGDKIIVYATDFEHDDYHSGQLAKFAAGCSLLIYDAHYFESEYEDHIGWGHSTAEEGIKLKRLCGAKKLLLFHHSPSHSDDALDELLQQLSETEPDCDYARCGEEIII